MKIICTTSNAYHHLLPVFTYLFNKNFPDNECTIVGYDKPACDLPDNFKFESMGVQGEQNEWSTDLRKYFEAQSDEWFIWIMEDTFIRSVSDESFIDCCALMMPGVGRIGLTKDIQNRQHTVTAGDILYAHPGTKYRLSTQPSIWNKEFLLQYLTDGLTPWEFETQPTVDDWHIVTTKEPAMCHNEGVRRFDIHALDLNGFSAEEQEQIKKLTND